MKKISCILIILLLLVSCNNKKTFEMVFVEGGSFYMGTNDSDADIDEKEIREVAVDDFYIGKYEVTQAEWKSVMHSNPSMFVDDDNPVECVSWDDVQQFIDSLNAQTGRHFRLSTRAEWEYAAFGGKNKPQTRYAGGNNLLETGWFCNNSQGKTHNVGTKNPNALNLYDMTGNVFEWCDEMYDSLYYSMDTIMNQIVVLDDIRVFKGGGWASFPKYCRISNINYITRKMRSSTIGFRLAESVLKSN